MTPQEFSEAVSDLIAKAREQGLTTVEIATELDCILADIEGG